MKHIPTWVETYQKDYSEEVAAIRPVTESDILDVCMTYRHFHGAREGTRKDLAAILYKLAEYYDE